MRVRVCRALRDQYCKLILNEQSRGIEECVEQLNRTEEQRADVEQRRVVW